MNIFVKRMKKYDECYNNIIEGIELSNVSTVVKVFGINVDTHLNFDRHRAFRIGNAEQKIHLLFRVFIIKEAKLALFCQSCLIVLSCGHFICVEILMLLNLFISF